MGKKGGRNKLKRLSAPRNWDIARKKNRFVYKPVPGSHPIARSYPLGVVIRDLAGLAETGRELKSITRNGKVHVDGRPVLTARFPVGLFDVVTVPTEDANFRMVPSPKGLALLKVDKSEAGVKLCAVRSKVKTKGGHIQFGLHDGRSIVDDSLKVAPGDALLLEVPSQKVISDVKLEAGSIGLILSGERAGQTGKISEVKKGTISREKMVKISLPSGDAEIPSRLVLPVGSEKPLITVVVSQP
ncbi:MAG TPA: 30S ribosomal protein S4e [Nitrososphaerales archaeon]|nr:30S ribosomal protein S4e [Nitrososphaerales archaeon]